MSEVSFVDIGGCLWANDAATNGVAYDGAVFNAATVNFVDTDYVKWAGIFGASYSLTVAGLNIGISLTSPISGQHYTLEMAGLSITPSTSQPTSKQHYTVTPSDIGINLPFTEPEDVQDFKNDPDQITVGTRADSRTLTQDYKTHPANLITGLSFSNVVVRVPHGLVVNDLLIVPAIASRGIIKANSLIVDNLVISVTPLAPLYLGNANNTVHAQRKRHTIVYSAHYMWQNWDME